ncbi:MAG: flagellar hook-basal body complex protein [Campylobacterales bacterium]|nr:flagellar hook-basal body complex protein [Campylobacterales bacterium]
MISSLWNGVSGIDTYAKAIDVQSNDISNVNTIGHKKSDIRFEDLMYDGNNINKGHGVRVQSINKNFSQGDIKSTGVSYDVAIKGDGFFVVVDPIDNQSFYTRAGNFKMGPNGYLLTSDNLQVQSIVASPVKTVGTTGISKFDDTFSEFVLSKNLETNESLISINTKVSDYAKSASNFGLSGNNLKSKYSLISDIEAGIKDYKQKLDVYASNTLAASVPSKSQVSEISFDTVKINLQASGDFISVNINNNVIRQEFKIDADNTMKLFSDKLSALLNVDSKVEANGKITISSTIPGQEIKISGASVNNLLVNTNTLVKAEVGSGKALFDSAQVALQELVQRAGGKFLQMENSILSANEKNLNMSNLNLKLDKLDISDYSFPKLEITNGNIYLKDGDNKFLVGKIANVSFSNNTGLTAVGNNNYTQTKTSGNAIYSGDTSQIIGNSLELSTSNLGENLTELLVLQKAFEANSKIITTSDEFLKTAINLKR